MTDETATRTAGVDGARLFDVDEWAPATVLSLTDRFMVPPFTVMDTRQGYWQDRKREWQALGMQSELGRGEDLAYHIGEWDAQRDPDARLGADGQVLNTRRAADERSNVTGAPDLPDYADNGMAKMAPGTSIFDPVLTECAVRWHTPDDAPAHVLDPFAGGSVRGMVSAILGREYTGVELRAEQVAANGAQVPHVLGGFPDAPTPRWIAGDSRDIDLHAGDRYYDMILSCPPYADLEVYSDDPADLSTMDYADFIDAYERIIARSVDLLRPDRFAVWVVGEARDTSRQGSPSYGLIADTVKAFQKAGMDLYNEAILVNVVGTLALRVTRQFKAGRKMGRCHQHVLVFSKGDPMAAARWAEGDRDD